MTMNLVIDTLIFIARLAVSYVIAFLSLFTPAKPKDVSGKLVFITGAGRGFGRELALRLARLKCRLVLVDIDEAAVAETSNLAREFGVEVKSYRCDVTKVKDVALVGNKVRSEMGDVDILINNAGVMNGKALLKLEETEIRRTLDINTLAHFWTVKEFLPAMIVKNSGHIVAVSSMAGQVGTQLLTDYCASKFAVHGFCEALERELSYLKADNVKITTVYPMAANTRLVTDISDHCVYKHRLSPLLSVEEVAEAMINGILTNERQVFIPAYLKHLKWSSLFLTSRGLKLFEEFIGAAFCENN